MPSGHSASATGSRPHSPAGSTSTPATRSPTGSALPSATRGQAERTTARRALRPARALAVLPTAHPRDVALDPAVREREPRTEGPAAALRALARRAHKGPPARCPRGEHVVDPAHCALAVRGAAGRARHVDGHRLALLMPARDRADRRELVRAPPQ